MGSDYSETKLLNSLVINKVIMKCRKKTVPRNLFKLTPVNWYQIRKTACRFLCVRIEEALKKLHLNAECNSRISISYETKMATLRTADIVFVALLSNVILSPADPEISQVDSVIVMLDPLHSKF